MTFADRCAAGRQLAVLLESYRHPQPVVVGLARGGVAVASEIARALGAPLEVWITRRIHAPEEPEMTLGAVSEDGAVALNKGLIARLALPELLIALQVVQEATKVERLVRVMRGGPPVDMRGRVVILVDDGIVTGASIRAAARSIQARQPSEIVLAVPVGSLAVVEELEPDFDCVVCLESGDEQVAIRSCYRDFWPVSEEDVAALMTQREREQVDELASIDRDFDPEWESETTQSP